MEKKLIVALLAGVALAGTVMAAPRGHRAPPPHHGGHHHATPTAATASSTPAAATTASSSSASRLALVRNKPRWINPPGLLFQCRCLRPPFKMI